MPDSKLWEEGEMPIRWSGLVSGLYLLSRKTGQSLTSLGICGLTCSFEPATLVRGVANFFRVTSRSILLFNWEHHVKKEKELRQARWHLFLMKCLLCVCVWHPGIHCQETALDLAYRYDFSLFLLHMHQPMKNPTKPNLKKKMLGGKLGSKAKDGMIQTKHESTTTKEKP